jgi:hypothetical protein
VSTDPSTGFRSFLIYARPPNPSVFSVPTHVHAAYQIKALPHNIKKYIFRMKVDDLPPLYHYEGVIGEKHYAPGGAGHA